LRSRKKYGFPSVIRGYHCYSAVERYEFQHFAAITRDHHLRATLWSLMRYNDVFRIRFLLLLIRYKMLIYGAVVVYISASGYMPASITSPEAPKKKKKRAVHMHLHSLRCLWWSILLFGGSVIEPSYVCWYEGLNAISSLGAPYIPLTSVR
jgi:hypothetical protein